MLETFQMVITPKDSITSSLSRSPLPQKDQTIIIDELKKQTNINRCSPNDFYEIVFAKDSTDWISFAYYPVGSQLFYLVRKRTDGSITSSTQKLGLTTVEVRKKGTIESSLWESMRALGISPEAILSFVDIFQWQLDFNTETQKGDRFTIVFEEDILDKKKTVAAIRIKAAQYKTDKRALASVYFASSDGRRKGFFDLDGMSVKRMFLSAPLQYRRISSYFSGARMHPILKYVRPHSGIDYAAPEGTPVSAVADGVVIKAQRDNSLGNYIMVKHSMGYETSYGHLRNFAAGIRVGSSVKQGQLIGYVGQTGLATGPHLDFRIKLNGKLFNFLDIKQPPAAVLTTNDKPDFNKTVDAYLPLFD
jgi:murein DD-endopeptidase MepM/ murein hydrolase activator NlpD